MRVYKAIRDWVDRQLRGAGRPFKTVLLPGLVPLLPALVVGQSLTLGLLCGAWFVAWHGFVMWRAWLCFRNSSVRADES